jgi:hypothetical protein
MARQLDRSGSHTIETHTDAPNGILPVHSLPNNNTCQFRQIERCLTQCRSLGKLLNRHRETRAFQRTGSRFTLISLLLKQTINVGYNWTCAGKQGH